jgi:hypothetical protein
MMSPAGMAIATITVMLWIVWSDTIRARRPAPVLYAVRIALYLIVSGLLLVNSLRYPGIFAGTARWLTFAAVAVGLFGAAYFTRRLVRRL